MEELTQSTPGPCTLSQPFLLSPLAQHSSSLHLQLFPLVSMWLWLLTRWNEVHYIHVAGFIQTIPTGFWAPQWEHMKECRIISIWVWAQVCQSETLCCYRSQFNPWSAWGMKSLWGSQHDTHYCCCWRGNPQRLNVNFNFQAVNMRVIKF